MVLEPNEEALARFDFFVPRLFLLFVLALWLSSCGGVVGPDDGCGGGSAIRGGGGWVAEGGGGRGLTADGGEPDRELVKKRRGFRLGPSLWALKANLWLGFMFLGRAGSSQADGPK